MDKKTYVGLKALDMGFDAHLTLVYTGNLSPRRLENFQKIISKYDPNTRYLGVRQEIKMFGSNFDIPVVTIMPSDELVALHQDLVTSGIKSVSQYPWSPHVTLNVAHGQEIRIPLMMKFTELGFY